MLLSPWTVARAAGAAGTTRMHRRAGEHTGLARVVRGI